MRSLFFWLSCVSFALGVTAVAEYGSGPCDVNQGVPAQTYALPNNPVLYHAESTPNVVSPQVGVTEGKLVGPGGKTPAAAHESESTKAEPAAAADPSLTK